MNKRCESCNSCGMPLEKPEDYALGDIQTKYCVYCTDSKGHLKTFDEILEGMTTFLMSSQGLAKEAAHRMAQEVLETLPAWKHLNKKK